MRNWTTLMLGWVATVGGGVSWSSDIAPVVDRDPNPLTSPRFPVKEVVVDSFVPFEALGITAANVDAFLAERLAALAATNAAGPTGFTAAELEEVGKLLNAMGVHRGRGELSAREAADLLALVREQKKRRGVSVVELERLAAELAEFYRTRGLPLTVVYVPVQDVRGDRVVLAVEPGMLERVAITGEVPLPEQLIQSAFAALIGKPVEHDPIAQVLYRVNALPGLETDNRFVAGGAVGESVLTMNVRNGQRVAGRLRADNHGNERSGERRVLGELDWYNPTGGGDVFNVGAMGADDPDKTTSGFARYERPFGSLGTVAHVHVATGAFDWQDASTRLDGDNLVTEVGARHQLRDNRTTSLAIDGAVGWQRLGLDHDAIELDDERIMLGSVGVSGRRVDDRSHVVASGRVGVDVGSYLDGGPEGSSSFVRLIGNVEAWRLVPVLGFSAPQRLRLRMTGQAATEPLPGTLELPLGGAGRAGAFDSALVSVDDGAYVGVDLGLRSARWPWGEIRVFADAAYGEQKRSFDDDLWAFLADAGVALDVALPMGVATEVRWSIPLSAKGEDDAIDEDGARWLWVLSYQPGWIR